MGLRSGAVKSGRVDLGGRFGDQDRYGYRFNVFGEEGRTYNGSTIDRKACSLVVDARITNDLTWDASFVRQDRMLRDANPHFSLGLQLTRPPQPVDGARDFSVDGAYVGVKTWGLNSGLRLRINADWNASVVVGHNHYLQNISSLMPRSSRPMDTNSRRLRRSVARRPGL